MVLLKYKKGLNMKKVIAVKMFKESEMPDIKKFEKLYYDGEKVESLRKGRWLGFILELFDAGLINSHQLSTWEYPSIVKRKEVQI